MQWPGGSSAALPTICEKLAVGLETCLCLGAHKGAVAPLPLQATHRKVLDVLNRVGLSDSLLRVAERRQRIDRLLVQGGMLLVVVLVGLLYWWLKR